MDQEYFKVSPNSVLLAYLRSIFNLPYAEQIAGEIGAKDLFRHWAGEESSSRLHLTPLYEARCRGTDRVVQEILTKQPIAQVLELGAGFSPFGLIYTQMFPNLVYLEVDRPEVIERKARLVKKLVAKPPAGYHLIPANFLDRDQLEQVVKNFHEPDPILIYHVDLLEHLDQTQKTDLGSHFYEILDRFSGFWITPDPAMNNERRRELGRYFSEPLLSSDTGENFFTSESEADRFFDELDFTIHKEPQLKGYDLISPKKLHLPPHVTELLEADIRQFGKVWKLRSSTHPRFTLEE